LALPKLMNGEIRVKDAKELVRECNSSIEEIQKEYATALNEKEIKPQLLIRIKNFMENLRSSLDFTAHALFDKYGDRSSRKNICFPYAWEGLDITKFRNKNRIEKCIPGLSSNRPDIVAKIEGYQYFSGKENAWLPKFMDLNNENKHQRLTPQKRRERKELRISSGGASMSLGEGALGSMERGASIRMGRMVIPGGQSFNVNKPPITFGEGEKEIITWVSFHFTSNKQPVMPFLKQALRGVEKIVNELSNM